MTGTASIAQIADMATFKPRARPDSRLVSFQEFEALFSQLRQALGENSVAQAMEYLGYAGGTHVADWRRKGKVPVLAMNAIRDVLADLKVEPMRRVERQFSTEELSRIFALCVGIDIPPEQKGPLLAKIAKELADVSR